MKNATISRGVWFGGSLLVLAACGGEGSSSTKGGASDPGAQVGAPTYWSDVAPILRDKCTGCHQAGGIGPFRLTSYAEAKAMAFPIASATRRGVMPPYLITHDGTCGEFEDDETLSPAQIATLERWAMTGQAEGQPSLPAVKETSGPSRETTPAFKASEEWRTPSIVPIAAGGALAEADEYRCFPLATTIDKKQFIVGSDIQPGNASLVHHVEVFVVNPAQQTPSGKSNADVMLALDQADGRPGWPCFGDAGQGVAADGAAVVWAPGQGPVTFPDKMGMPVQPGDRIVVQVHYNLAHPGTKGQMDSTTVRLAYADAVERRLMVIAPDKFLDTIENAPPDSLPAGDPAARYTWTLKGSELGEVPDLEIVAVMPHMHGRGVREQMHLRGPSADNACIAEVNHWDFHWQKFYFFAGPRPRFTAKSALEVTCEYDTSKDRSPVLPGWGTGNEMCAAILMVALPPGM